MLYNSHDGPFSKLAKQLVFWLSLAAMLGLFMFLLNNEVQLPQRQISLDIDIKNKINICTPQDEKELNRRKPYKL